MYLAAFALLSAAAALGAWRRNPMFSNRTTARFIVVITLALGALVLAAIAIAEFTANASPAVAFASVAAFCVGGTLALICIIFRLASPSPATLPRSTVLVDFHRSRLRPWYLRVGLTLLALVILAVVVPAEFKLLVYTLGGMIVSLGIVMLVAGYLAALYADRSLTAVEANPWVHWRYTKAEWDAWTSAEVDRLASQTPVGIWQRDWLRLAIPLLVIAAAIFGLNFGTIPPGWAAICTAIAWILYIGIFALGKQDAKAAPRRLRRMLLNAAPEAYLGPAGVFADGEYIEWQSAANWLVEATLDERQPRCLSFRFEQIVPGAIATTELRLNVLVPHGAGADIARLQSALSIAYPKAHIALQ